MKTWEVGQKVFAINPFRCGVVIGIVERLDSTPMVIFDNGIVWHVAHPDNLRLWKPGPELTWEGKGRKRDAGV